MLNIAALHSVLVTWLNSCAVDLPTTSCCLVRRAAPIDEIRIMKKITSLFISLPLLLIASASIACEYPKRVVIPNGNSATKEDMIMGQRGVKEYVASMEIYLECIVEEEKQAREAIADLTPELEQEREDVLNKKYNAAVDEMERVAAQFNAEVQAYRAREDS